MGFLNAYEPWGRRGATALASLVLLFALYKIGAYFLDGYENKKTYEAIRDVYYEAPASPSHAAFPSAIPVAVPAEPAPDAAAHRRISAKFAPLVARNADTVGWIKIDGTKIDYPVMQAEDNEFYLTRDADKNDNAAGSIFMDYRNDAGGKNRNVILFGHDMKNKTMFANLLEYESRWNFENKATIEFDSIYEDARWIIFSAYTTDTSFDYIRTDFKSDEEFGTFLDTVKAKSLHRSEVEVTPQDAILTLSTCSSAGDDARFVVHAKRVSE